MDRKKRFKLGYLLPKGAVLYRSKLCPWSMQKSKTLAVRVQRLLANDTNFPVPASVLHPLSYKHRLTITATYTKKPSHCKMW